MGSINSPLQAAIDAAISRFIDRNPISRSLHEEAAKSLPGGNTRSTLHTDPFPICMKRGEGYKVYDEDDHEYNDLSGELSAGLYGHSHPLILKSIETTIHTVGLSLGATTRQEARFAASLCHRFNIDRIRFTNSGLEANLHCLNAARRYTGRRKVLVFRGGYHGGVLSFVNGPAENAVDKTEWVMAQYNHIESVRAALQKDPDIAAILVEGMQGAGGYIPGTKEFLMGVQEEAKKVGAVFILDEVVTSRLAPAGLKSILGLDPDLVTFGKYLGGSMAFGAFGGKENVMAVYDPRLAKNLVHTGTFQNNTLGMHAGAVGLEHIFRPELVGPFNEMGDALRNKLQKMAKGTKMTVTGIGSLICTHFFVDEPVDVTCHEQLRESLGLKTLFWMEMVEAGYWFQKRGSFALIFGTPPEVLDKFADSVERFLQKYKYLLQVE